MTSDTTAVSRRTLFTGRRNGGPGRQEHCISSALVSLLPGREEAVLAALGAMEGVEIGPRRGAKLVLVLEGPGNGAVGSLLAKIAVMEGVISANMVYEHSEGA